MYKLELGKEGYTIVNASTGAKLATVTDIVQAIADVRACNRTEREALSAASAKAKDKAIDRRELRNRIAGKGLGMLVI